MLRPANRQSLPRLWQRLKGRGSRWNCCPTVGVSLPVWVSGRQVEVAAGAGEVEIIRFAAPRGVEAVITRFGNGMDEDQGWDNLAWYVRINNRGCPYGWSNFRDQRGSPENPIDAAWWELTGDSDFIIVTAALDAASPITPVHPSATLAGYTV